MMRRHLRAAAWYLGALLATGLALVLIFAAVADETFRTPWTLVAAITLVGISVPSLWRATAA